MNVAGPLRLFPSRAGRAEEPPVRLARLLAALLLVIAVGYARCCATRRSGGTAWPSSPRVSPGTSWPSGTRVPREPLQARLRARSRLRDDARTGQVRGPHRPRVYLRVRLGHSLGHDKGRGKAGQIAVVAWQRLASQLHANLSVDSADRSRRARCRPRGRSPRASPARGTVLFLPWREYFPTPFTDQRMIANPAALSFSGTVLASQNPGLATPSPRRTPSTCSSTR